MLRIGFKHFIHRENYLRVSQFSEQRMVISLPWMTRVDHHLLDWLSEYNIIFTPRVLYANIDRELADHEAPSYSQVKRRIRFLTDEANLLERYQGERGNYVLSDLGERFIQDDLTDDERERLAELD